MSDSTHALPFELVSRNGSLRAYWSEQKVRIEVASEDSMATLHDVVARWAEVKETIAKFVRGLATDDHVPLDPATIGGFAARSCGFDEPLAFESITVSAPDRVVATFYTGFPDGYATYKVVMVRGVPTELSAFAS